MKTKFIDADLLRQELDTAHKTAMAEADASAPVRMTSGVFQSLGGLVTTMVKHLAQNCRRNHDELEARIVALEAGRNAKDCSDVQPPKKGKP